MSVAETAPCPMVTLVRLPGLAAAAGALVGAAPAAGFDASAGLAAASVGLAAAGASVGLAGAAVGDDDPAGAHAVSNMPTSMMPANHTREYDIDFLLTRCTD